MQPIMATTTLRPARPGTRDLYLLRSGPAATRARAASSSRTGHIPVAFRNARSSRLTRDADDLLQAGVTNIGCVAPICAARRLFAPCACYTCLFCRLNPAYWRGQRRPISAPTLPRGIPFLYMVLGTSPSSSPGWEGWQFHYSPSYTAHHLSCKHSPALYGGRLPAGPSSLSVYSTGFTLLDMGLQNCRHRAGGRLQAGHGSSALLVTLASARCNAPGRHRTGQEVLRLTSHWAWRLRSALGRIARRGTPSLPYAAAISVGRGHHAAGRHLSHRAAAGPHLRTQLTLARGLRLLRGAASIARRDICGSEGRFSRAPAGNAHAALQNSVHTRRHGTRCLPSVSNYRAAPHLLSYSAPLRNLRDICHFFVPAQGLSGFGTLSIEDSTLPLPAP